MQKIYTVVWITLACATLFMLYFTLKSNLGESYFYTQKNSNSSVKTIYKIGLLADSHTDYQRLKKSVAKLKQKNVNFILHFGDMSDFGGSEELSQTKKILDDSGIDYLVIPGDRDIVEGGINFNKIFNNKTCFDKLLEKYEILCLANPYNYTLLDKSYYDKFIVSSAKAKILLTSQPIYNPNSNVYMGFYDAGVKRQAENIYEHILKNTKIKYVVSADAHFFKTYSSNGTRLIKYFNLGAITDKKNLQNPNFAVMNIFENGTIEVNQQLTD